jgi:hypothetical protein
LLSYTVVSIIVAEAEGPLEHMFTYMADAGGTGTGACIIKISNPGEFGVNPGCEKSK